MASRSTDRRTVLITAGAAAVAAAAGPPAAAQATEIRGTVRFDDGRAIPAGRLEVYLEDPTLADSARRVGETHLDSVGTARAIPFALPFPADTAVSATLRLVARLERSDGWLFARGSARADPGASADIALSLVMY
jgi:uncharacterized lipoprotein YbaY